MASRPCTLKHVVQENGERAAHNIPAVLHENEASGRTEWRISLDWFLSIAVPFQLGVTYVITLDDGREGKAFVSKMDLSTETVEFCGTGDLQLTTDSDAG